MLSTDINTSVLAGLRKICNLTFQNNFVGVGNGGVISVNNNQYNSPTSQFNVIEQNNISAYATGQTINGIIYSFSQWNDGNTQQIRTFNPTAHATYTASFIGKPDNANRNLHFGTTVGQPIVLYWSDNPNTNVTQYQIWRKVKGIAGEVLLRTVNRGTTTFTDNDYALASTYIDVVYYDVRSYYSVEGTYSVAQYNAVYGQLLAKESNSNSSPGNSINEKKVTEYSISNYPNPFNPTTTINYQLPQDGLVTIKIYDMLGKEVSTLVNEFKNTGRYNVSFNASNLASGTYLYQLKVNDFVATKKLVLLK